MAKFYLQLEIRFIDESCPKCWGIMYSFAFINNDWFSFIAGTLPKCLEIGCNNDK